MSELTFDQARAAIEERVQQQLIGSRVSVTMGDLRSIRVFVLGEAEKPGSYTVSGLSTMTNALFVSGGVKKIGSLRNIELKRDGHLVTVLDLYDLLLHGDTSHDQHLMPGDVIFIPPIGNTVSVYGSVRRPAIYELKGEKDVEQVIEVAGGLVPDADGKLVQLERIRPSRLREMINIDLTSNTGRTTAVDNGDKLRVPAIRPTLENSVVLSGFVFRPGSFEYRPGLRLSDVLPSFDELRPNADRRYIMIRREIPPEEKIEVISANLERALNARGSKDDPELRPRDKIIVFDLSASRERVVEPVVRELELQASPDHPAQVVSIDGKVKAPGRYPLEPTMRVSDLIRAGGSMDDSAYGGEAELTRYTVADGNVRQTRLIPIDLAAIHRGDAAADIQLMPYDVLVVKLTPQWTEPGTIELTGEVRFPGRYPITRGETLSSVLRRAGGFTDLAFEEGAVYIREELKKREKEQLDLLTNRLQSDLAALSLEAVASSAATTNANASAGATQGLAVGQSLIEQLRETKPVGRLVINLDRVMQGRPGGPEDVQVRDGDKLLRPEEDAGNYDSRRGSKPHFARVRVRTHARRLYRQERWSHSKGGSESDIRRAGERRRRLRSAQRVVQALQVDRDAPRRHDRRAAGYRTDQSASALAGGYDHYLQLGRGAAGGKVRVSRTFRTKSSAMRVLVVIPCLNEVRHLEGLVSDLIRSNAEAVHIVIADGGSTDGTLDLANGLAARYSNVSLLINPKRLQSAGFNLAVSEFGEDAEFVIRIDAHAEYPSDYCQVLVEEAERTGAASVVVAMKTMGIGWFQRAVAEAQNSRLGNGGAAHRLARTDGAWTDHGHHALMRIDAFKAGGGV